MKTAHRLLIPTLLLLAGLAHAGDRPKVKFKDASGQVAFELKAEADGAKLVDGAGQELARLHTAGDELKLKDAKGAALGHLLPSGTGWTLRGPAGNFVVQRPGQGFTVLDEKGAVLATVSVQGGTATVSNGAGAELARAEGRGEKVKLTGAHPLETKGNITALAAAAFAVEALPLPYRAALAYALNGGRL